MVVSILLYGCTTWTLTKRMEKKLDGNYTRMLRAILNKSWRQNATKQQLYGHLPLIAKTIQVRRTRHAGHCRRSWDELISDILLWTPLNGRAKAWRSARTYIQQLRANKGCSLEDLPERLRRVAGEGQGDLCWWRDIMIMIILIINRIVWIRTVWRSWIAWNRDVISVITTFSMSKTVPFQTMQFSISTQFKCQTAIFDP